jgi:hypothetical protein
LIVDSIDRNLTDAGQLTPENAPVRVWLAEQDWPTAVAWVGVQLAEGLHYAHLRGVLHRDIKPANILLSAEGLPKLADFNVSFSGVAGRAGAAANFGGSLAYMSPEQLRAADSTDDFSAEQLDHRSDLFSLAVVLWELLRGERPWRLGSRFSNWSEAIQVQRASRQQELSSSSDTTAVGRVLDQVLRITLAESRDQRPGSGAAMAGELRLALHPAAAERFHPSPGSLAHWLSRVPPVLAISITALLPNLAAGVFNYLYNGTQIVAGYPALWPKFVGLAAVVNAVLFPLGLALGIWKMWPMLRGSAAAKRGEPPSRQGLAVTWTIGHVIACISGSLWIIGGLIFPFGLMAMEPEYRFGDAIHFFASLSICGGVAMTYPFFLVSLISVLCLYPQMVRPVLYDSEFDARRQWMLRRCRQYLALAAMVPLLALVLLAFRDQVPRVIVLATIGTTALGLLASFLAYQWIDDALRQMAAVLSPRPSLARPEEQI